MKFQQLIEIKITIDVFPARINMVMNKDCHVRRYDCSSLASQVKITVKHSK